MSNIIVPPILITNYLEKLVDRFYKILPIKEREESSLKDYIDSLQVEIIGCKELIISLSYDSSIMTLLSILQYLKNNPEVDHKIVKREVFKAIDICKKLSSIYGTKEDAQHA